MVLTCFHTQAFMLFSSIQWDMLQFHIHSDNKALVCKRLSFDMLKWCHSSDMTYCQKNACPIIIGSNRTWQVGRAYLISCWIHKCPAAANFPASGGVADPHHSQNTLWCWSWQALWGRTQSAGSLAQPPTSRSAPIVGWASWWAQKGQSSHDHRKWRA